MTTSCFFTAHEKHFVGNSDVSLSTTRIIFVVALRWQEPKISRCRNLYPLFGDWLIAATIWPLSNAQGQYFLPIMRPSLEITNPQATCSHLNSGNEAGQLFYPCINGLRAEATHFRTQRKETNMIADFIRHLVLHSTQVALSDKNVVGDSEPKAGMAVCEGRRLKKAD